MSVTTKSIDANQSASEEIRIKIASRNGQYHVIATEDVLPNDRLMKIEGELVATPCRYSVQVGSHSHIAPPAGITRDDRHDSYLWRFLNHSCKPNAFIYRRVLFAIRPIAAGEEITFDYNSNEYDMAAPFKCRCGHCDGSEIRGYLHLTPAQRKVRERRVAEHLLDLPDQTNA